ncbi:phosphodiester glycosidase family protein [Alloiococcus sp. CFN-8]|uniref:phosphodiester glycosidase family protein n=1 Tax=Alloiococcus sp. CFN-8 TaxID=3416081 RepID=UPI003CF34411
MKNLSKFIFLSFSVILFTTACTKTPISKKESEPTSSITSTAEEIEIAQDGYQADQEKQKREEDTVKKEETPVLDEKQETAKIEETENKEKEAHKAKVEDISKDKPAEVQKAKEAPKEDPKELVEKKATEELSNKRQKILSEVTFTEVNETVYATGDLNIRKGPSTDFDKVGALKLNQSVKRTGIGSNGWSRIEYKDEIAYASGNYLIKNKIETPKASSSKDKWSYSRKGLEIKIQKHSEYLEGGNVVYWIAEIKSDNISGDINTAFAGGSYASSVNTKQRTSTIAKNNNAILAINGDASGFRPKSSPYHNPVMIKNGKVEYGLIPGKSIGKMGALTSSGKLVIFDPKDYTSTEQLLDKGFTDTWWFDTALVIDGKVENIYDGNQSKYKAPYSAIGQKADGTFLFITVDGRGSNGSAGLNYGGMARLMKRYGAHNAYQMDGGGSATIWFNGEVLNRPSDGSERAISDIIYVRK